MARKIIIRDTGTNLSGSAPAGYRYLGYNNNELSELDNSTVTKVGALPYETYTVLLTQFDVNKPTAKILQNTFVPTVDWSYSDVGQYTLTITGGFPDADKIFVSGAVNGGSVPVFYKWVYGGSNSIKIYVTDSNGTEADSLITDASFELRVYT